jgi:2-oxoisovalerate dehydrogenase E2 component (dihydrolipoyl transacylase)
MMSEDTHVVVPHLAESLVSATVGKWLVRVGDSVAQYAPLCELVTEKVTTEMPSPYAGVVAALCVAEGTEAPVGATLCILRAPAVHNARLSPAVRHLVRKHNVALASIVGSGRDGRITRRDVERVIAQRDAPPPAPPPAPPSAPLPVVDARPGIGHGVGSKVATDPTVRTSGIHLSEEPRIPQIEVEQGDKSEYFIDVTPIRNVIASRMRQSVSEIPHAWTMIEVDVTSLVALRNKLKDEFFRQEGVNLTYLSFMIKAVVRAIKDYPIMNSVWAVDKIIVKRDINLSLAVGTEDSVATPVIKQADRKNIAGIAREIDELARKTRKGQLALHDVSGGTFTVNNTGSFGSILSQPIINYPQAAIVTFESIVKRPIVVHDMIAVRSMVNICLSLDHRILDGVICGRFLQRVKENLEAYDASTTVY